MLLTMGQHGANACFDERIISFCLVLDRRLLSLKELHVQMPVFGRTAKGPHCLLLGESILLKKESYSPLLFIQEDASFSGAMSFAIVFNYKKQTF